MQSQMWDCLICVSKLNNCVLFLQTSQLSQMWLKLMLQTRLSPFLLQRSPSLPLHTTTASPWTCAVSETSGPASPSTASSGESQHAVWALACFFNMSMSWRASLWLQIRLPVLRQRGSHHDESSSGGEEEHGGVSATVVLCLWLCCSAQSASGHFPQVRSDL